jgi:hypothetical protein
MAGATVVYSIPPITMLPPVTRCERRSKQRTAQARPA